MKICPKCKSKNIASGIRTSEFDAGPQDYCRDCGYGNPKKMDLKGVNFVFPEIEKNKIIKKKKK